MGPVDKEDAEDGVGVVGVVVKGCGEGVLIGGVGAGEGVSCLLNNEKRKRKLSLMEANARNAADTILSLISSK